MGDSMPRPDTEECQHPFRDVEERTVRAYVDNPTDPTAGEDRKLKLRNSATISFCTECEKIVGVDENGLKDLKYLGTVDYDR